ncbi:MAG: O-antigen/teichoic acid export membrane protein [Alteromonadaceae bacterium]|jgi:O-antigen/teichoic acid export membrane protein
MTFSTLVRFACGPFIVAALGLISVPLMAWIFPPNVIGQIAMFNIFLSGCTLVLTLGFDQAYVREYHEVNNKEVLFKSLFSTSLVIVCLFCLGIIIFHDVTVNILFDEKQNTLWIATGIAVAVVFSIFYRFSSLILRMKEQGIKYSLLQVSAKLFLVVGLLGLLLVDNKPSFFSAFVLSCFALVFAGVTAFMLNKKECALAYRSKLNKEQIQRAMKFGFPLVISGFIYWGLISVDRWAIRYFSGLDDLGLYSVAFSFAAVMTIFQQVFSTVWAPIVYQWNKKGVDILQLNLITDWVVIILSTVFVIVSILSPLLTLFLPEAYAEVVYLLPACMLYPVFYTLSETTVVGMNIARKTNYSIVVTLFPLLLNILLCYILIPLYGAGGAAVAVATSFYLYLIIRTEISKHVWRSFNSSKLYVVSALLLLTAMVPALTKLDNLWPSNIVLLLIVFFVYWRRFRSMKLDLITLMK